MAASRRRFPQVKKIGTPEAMRDHLAQEGIDLHIDTVVEPAPNGPLAEPMRIGPHLEAANRFAGRNVLHRGARGLHHHLLGRLSEGHR